MDLRQIPGNEWRRTGKDLKGKAWGKEFRYENGTLLWKIPYRVHIANQLLWELNFGKNAETIP